MTVNAVRKEFKVGEIVEMSITGSIFRKLSCEEVESKKVHQMDRTLDIGQIKMLGG